MPNMTLSLPEDLKSRMDQFREINWSEVARQAIREKTMMLEKMNALMSADMLLESEAAYEVRKMKKKSPRKPKP